MTYDLGLPAPRAPLGSGSRPSAVSTMDDNKLQALFRSVVLQANDVVLVTEAEPTDLASGGPRVVYVNPAFTRMTGYAFEDIVGRTPRLLQSPRTDRAQLAKISAAVSTWQPVEVELLNVRKDGTEFWVQLSISPAKDERGWFTHWIAIQRDISGRRLREEAVQAMLAGSSDLMLLLTADADVTAASRSAADLLGRNPAELVGCNVRQLLHPDDRAPALAVLFPGSALRLGSGNQVEVRMSHADRSWRWMRLTAADLAEHLPGMVVVSCADVSETRRSAAALEQLNDKFRSAFRDAPIGMALSDAGGNLLQTNAALVRLLGRPESELLQMTMDELRATGGGPGCDSPPTATPDVDAEPRRQERLLRRADGTVVEVLQSSSVVAGSDGRPTHVVDHIEDITDRKSFEQQLQHQALHDPLTGLANRALLTDRIDQALSSARPSTREIAVLFLDLDRFKSVNDTLGHSAGDTMLSVVSRLLMAEVRQGDTVARLGGDEFVVLCPDCTAHQAASLATRIQLALADATIADTVDVHLSASIGIAQSSPTSSSATTLLRDADAAMYAAKARGRNRIEIFDEAVGARVRSKVHLEAELRRAIPAGQLRLHFQPIVELAGRRVVGAEALVRWQHPDRGLLYPGDFIALAEESDLILDLGAWVVDNAVAAAAARRGSGSSRPVTWVNLSVAQLQDSAFPALVQRSLAKHDLPGSALGLEITESMLIADLAHITNVLQNFRDLGIRSAIDDFGTGYSSLSFLARFPVDTVKIDQSVVAGLRSESTRRESYAIINAVVGLSRALGLDLIAEGIETPSQLEALHGLGCDYGQGFLLGRPVPD